MDGGGRVVEPLTGPRSGRADARLDRPPVGRKGWRKFSIPIVSPFAAMGLRNRSSVAVPLSGRLPRHLGSYLTLLFLGGVVGYGLVAGGQYQSFRDTYGDPRDAAAKAIGFGVEQVTISGLTQLTEADVLSAAGITDRASLPFLAVADVRARLQAGAARQACGGPQAVSERARHLARRAGRVRAVAEER
jgi:cell division protein FtsQ